MTTATKPKERSQVIDASVDIDRPRIVRPPRRRYLALNGATTLVIAAVALSIIGILYLVQTSQVAGLGYELGRLQAERDELALEMAKLGYDVSRYESLETVEGIATKQLGMVEMEEFRFLPLQRPASDQLPPAAPEEFPDVSLWDQVEGALLGIGRSRAHVEHDSQVTGVGETQP